LASSDVKRASFALSAIYQALSLRVGKKQVVLLTVKKDNADRACNNNDKEGYQHHKKNACTALYAFDRHNSLFRVGGNLFSLVLSQLAQTSECFLVHAGEFITVFQRKT